MVSISEVSSNSPVTKATTTTSDEKSTSTNGKTTTTTTTTTTTSSSRENVITFYENPDQLKKLCDFLRSQHGPPVREALLMEKRVHYLKGEKLVNFLVEPKKGTKWPSKLLRFQNRHDAIMICKELCKHQYLLRSEKCGKGELEVSRIRDFDETGYFTWVYQGDQKMTHLMSAGLVIGILFCVCFPIWPQFLRIFVWYMSVTLLLVIFSILISRGTIFLFIWVLGYECWFLPNLFDETLGFVESFQPIYSFEATKPGQLPYRIGVAVAFLSFCWWAVTQPSEFDGFVAAQGDFLKDLYSGRLITDMSQADKENIDKPKMQSLDDLLKSLDDLDDETVENKNFLQEVEEEEQVDSLLDNLLDNEDEGDEDGEE